MSSTGARSIVDETIGAEEWTLSDLKRKVAEDSVLIQCLQRQTKELNEKVDSLSEDLRHLLKTVSTLKVDQNEGQKKTRGGRTAVSPHFFLSFLQNNDSIIPLMSHTVTYAFSYRYASRTGPS